MDGIFSTLGGGIVKILERIAKLIDVKSIMTLTLTGIFAFMAVYGTVDADKFLTIFTMIVSFYFGTQSMKNGGGQ